MASEPAAWPGAPLFIDPPGAAGGTKAAALAAERDKLLCVAVLAAHPQESMLEAAAFEIRLELFLHVLRQRSASRFGK